MSEEVTWKTLLTRTNFANIAAFLLVLGFMGYGLYYNDRDAIVASGSTALGYLFGASVKNQ